MTIWESLDERRRIYDYFVESLDAKRLDLLTREVLLDPARLLGGRGSDPAWSAQTQNRAMPVKA